MMSGGLVVVEVVVVEDVDDVVGRLSRFVR